jgi:hypothetical protein
MQPREVGWRNKELIEELLDKLVSDDNNEDENVVMWYCLSLDASAEIMKLQRA